MKKVDPGPEVKVSEETSAPPGPLKSGGHEEFPGTSLTLPPTTQFFSFPAFVELCDWQVVLHFCVAVFLLRDGCPVK